MKILILGHNGMLGNAVHSYFKVKYDVEIIDDCRWDSVEYKNKILYSNAEYIINCVGAIPQKKYSKEYYQFLNVNLPIYLEKTNKRIIHPSTDCEFSGNLVYPKKYTKLSVRDAVDDYGMSKAKISEMIINDFRNTKIIRTSIIGHEISSHFSLLDWFLNTNDDEILKGFSNHYWNGITTLQWSKIAEIIILYWNDCEKMIQIGVDELHKYDLLKIIAKVYSKSNTINDFKTEKMVNKMLVSDMVLPNIEEQLIELKNFYKNEKSISHRRWM